MQVKSIDLPGIGKKYTIHSAFGLWFVIIIHHSGRREMYFMNDPDDDEPILTFDLSDEESRKIGAILMGADYQPVSDDRVELLCRNIRVEWIKIQPDCEVIDMSIKDAQIRKKTGATVIGIQRGDEVIGSPDIHEVMRAGDILMAIGKKDQVGALKSLCQGRP